MSSMFNKTMFQEMHLDASPIMGQRTSLCHAYLTRTKQTSKI